MVEGFHACAGLLQCQPLRDAMGEAALRHARNYMLTLALVLLAGAAVSLYVSLRRAHSQYDELARAEGRAVFEAVMGLREWTTERGVYVSPTERALATEYPLATHRDVACPEVGTLTRINHAQMVRMFSEVLSQDHDIRLHITSLQPLLARNAADPWEKQALMSFSRGEAEAETVDKTGSGDSVFRYMAPLKEERSCLECHHERTDVGGIRGGITVSFNFAPFQRSMDQSARLLWLVHGLGLGVSLGLVTLLGTRLTQSVGALQASFQRIRQLEGLVPICAWCKKIRKEGTDPHVPSSWVTVERYLGERTAAQFSHGMCPECEERTDRDSALPKTT
jgi:hypothetical protein